MGAAHVSDFEMPWWEALGELILDQRERHGSPLPRATLDQLWNRLERFDFAEPRQDEDLIRWVAEHLAIGNVHTTHPRYFGLFNPSTLPITIAADTLVAAFNPQLAASSHSFGAQTIERWTLAYFQRLLGHDATRSVASFTSGGAEANHSATLAAATYRLPNFLEGAPAGARCYVSEHAHDSFAKIVKFCGLGRKALVRVPVDQSFRMDVQALEAAIQTDRSSGLLPFMVVGTAGTTAFGAIDPLENLARVCASKGLWFHVDAAWGGAALVSERLRPLFVGIERADSVTLDAHKWLSVPMGAGMFFSRHKASCEAVFSVDAVYMPGKSELQDPYTSTMQWSRRFIGLKVFMALANLGGPGYAALIERQCAMGDRLAELALERGFEIVTHSPLAMVSLRWPGMTIAPEEWLARIYAEGDAWVSLVPTPEGRKAIRACITHYATQETDLERLLDILQKTAV